MTASPAPFCEKSRIPDRQGKETRDRAAAAGEENLLGKFAAEHEKRPRTGHWSISVFRKPNKRLISISGPPFLPSLRLRQCISGEELDPRRRISLSCISPLQQADLRQQDKPAQKASAELFAAFLASSITRFFSQVFLRLLNIRGHSAAAFSHFI